MKNVKYKKLSRLLLGTSVYAAAEAYRRGNTGEAGKCHNFFSLSKYKMLLLM